MSFIQEEDNPRDWTSDYLENELPHWVAEYLSVTEWEYTEVPDTLPELPGVYAMYGMRGNYASCTVLAGAMNLRHYFRSQEWIEAKSRFDNPVIAFQAIKSQIIDEETGEPLSDQEIEVQLGLYLRDRLVPLLKSEQFRATE